MASVRQDLATERDRSDEVRKAGYQQYIYERSRREDEMAGRAADRAAADARYAELLDKFTALRIAGADVPEPKPGPAPKAEPDPVTQAIITKAGRSPVLRKHYGEYVREQRAAGVDDADIAKAILAGQSLDPELDGVPL